MLDRVGYKNVDVFSASLVEGRGRLVKFRAINTGGSNRKTTKLEMIVFLIENNNEDKNYRSTTDRKIPLTL